MTKKVRLGIIGFGNMGTAHYNNIAKGLCPEIEVAAIADSDPARYGWAVDNLPRTVAKFDDAEKMLDSGLIDAALISVPHYDHPRYAMECFKRHLHAMVEKPAGVYTKHVREMNEAAKTSGVVFGMMFNQRTDCMYRKMKEIVSGGQYGELRRVNWIITNWYRPQAYYDSGAWRATWSGEGGGVLLNQCPHQLDLWQWICGMPEEITAKMSYGRWHDIEVEDDVTAFLKYKNGATGVFITSTGDACGTNRFEVTLDGAKLVAEDHKLMMCRLETPESIFTKTNKETFGCPKGEWREVETDGKSPQHPAVLNSFAAAILRGEPLIAGGEEGINGLTLSNAMHLSDWLNKPVKLPFDEDLFYAELLKRVRSSRRKTGSSVFTDPTVSYNV